MFDPLRLPSSPALAPLDSLLPPPTVPAPAPPSAPDSFMPSITRREHVELLRVRVLGLVVLAGVLAEDLLRHLVRLGDEHLELAWGFRD